MSFMVGQKFPNETVAAVMPDGSVNESFNVLEYGEGRHTIVFFYPKDFTYVCPTEILAFDQAMPEFEARKTLVVGASVDTAQSHANWRNTPLREGGIEAVNYPLLADNDLKISKQLGILNADNLTYRASYLLDAEGIVRNITVNDLSLGRSVDEMLRLVDALQFTEQHGEVCPAGWTKGQEAIQTTSESTGDYLEKKHGKNSSKAA
jgi:peroxiredoxin (alkyl hydroperoxide reductase subunit C)